MKTENKAVIHVYIYDMRLKVYIYTYTRIFDEL